MGKHGKHRPLVGRNLTASVLVLGLSALPVAAACRQALALGHDVSGSVDRREYDLQMNGLATALENQDVQNAFLAMPGAYVRLFVFEWSGTGAQTEIIPWTEVHDPADLLAVAQTLRTPGNRPRSAETAVGEGMLFGGHALAGQMDCWKRTLDISADGTNNVGVHPALARPARLFDGVTINALVIANDTAGSKIPERTDSAPALRRYFRAHFIRGTDAFIQTAFGYDDYHRAIQKKLLKELETMAVGQLNMRDQIPKPSPGAADDAH